MRVPASHFFPLVCHVCKHNANVTGTYDVYFYSTSTALKVCASVINGRDALLIAKGLREKIFVQRRDLKEPTKWGD